MKRLTIPLTLSGLLILTYYIFSLSPDLIGEETRKYLLSAVIVSIGIVVVRGLSYILFDLIFLKRKGREAPELLRVVLSIVGYSALFFLIYRFILEQEVQGLLATSAVVTVILGLALQDTLGNFFAGLSLHIEQPYMIGDAIRVADLLGRVESVTWRTTTIRTNNNTVIILPNSRMARDPVEIYHLNKLNRRVLKFPGPYSVPPERVIPLVREAARSIPRVSTERAPIVRISEFSDSNITYELLYWVQDYMWASDIDSRIRERIWYVYSRHEINIPFPTRRVLLQPLKLPQKKDETDVRGTLDRVDLFAMLDDAEKEMMVERCARFAYAPGERILKQGDGGDAMYVICRGRVEIRTDAGNGNAVVLAQLGAGDYFGEMSLFTGAPRRADVDALEEVEVIEIKKAVIERLLREKDSLAESFGTVIAEREARLLEAVADASTAAGETRRDSILKRIRRFFSLS